MAAGASVTPVDGSNIGSEPLEATFSGLSDKAARKALHSLFKGDHGLPRLVTDTVTTDSGEQVIRLMTQAGLQASAHASMHPRFLWRPFASSCREIYFPHSN